MHGCVRRLNRLTCLWITMCFAATIAAQGGDWTAWRGPLQNGVSLETGLPSNVASELWRLPFGGRSTPTVFDGRVFAINLSGEGITEQERVFAADLATGKLLWEHRFNVFHTDVPNTRVGWATVISKVQVPQKPMSP